MRFVEGAEAAQGVEVVAGAAEDAEREAGAVGGDGREDGVQADAAECAGGQPGVDEWLGVVEPAPAAEGEPLSEAADGVLVGKGDVGAAEAAVAVEPDLVGCGDEDVGGAGRAEEGVERAGADELLAHEVEGVEDVRVADDAAGLFADGSRDLGRGDLGAAAGQPAADAVDEVYGDAHDTARVGVGCGWLGALVVRRPDDGSVARGSPGWGRGPHEPR